MDLMNDIKKVDLSRKRATRVGRGSGSGKGKTCGKGMKGQTSRSGNALSIVSEGGTMPLYRRIPKYGFNNFKFQKRWVAIDVEKLNKFSYGQEVTFEELVRNRVISCKRRQKAYIKIIGNGELKVEKLTVKVHKISESARKIIEDKKGTVTLLPIGPDKKKKK